MNSSYQLLANTIVPPVVLLGPALGLASCSLRLPGADSSNGSDGTVNVFEAAGLADTESIEIVELPEPGQDFGEAGQTVAAIAQPDDVHRILALLDTELPLVPPALCLERHQIRFRRPPDDPITFGYSCDEGGVFLRGDQSFWKGYEVHPPEAFQRLISGHLQP